MNIFNIFHRIKSEENVETDVTCPNCGCENKGFNKTKKFLCSKCGFSVPVITREKKYEPGILSDSVEFFCLVLGIVSAGFGLKGFLIPNGLIDGGVTGISMLVSKVSGISLAYFLITFNIPFIIISYHQINRRFALRAFVSIFGLAIILPFLDISTITNDRLLGAVFGGFFLGAGIGLSIKGGAVLDGTEILALYISKRFPATVGDVILFFNIVIFSTALLALNSESVLYSILTYLSASRTVDFILHGIESLSGVFIISSFSSQIRYKIVNEMERGITLLQGRGGYSEKNQDIIFCVVTRLEIPKIKSIVMSTDRNSFFVVYPISDVSGGFIKKILESKAERYSKAI